MAGERTSPSGRSHHLPAIGRREDQSEPGIRWRTPLFTADAQDLRDQGSLGVLVAPAAAEGLVAARSTPGLSFPRRACPERSRLGGNPCPRTAHRPWLVDSCLRRNDRVVPQVGPSSQARPLPGPSLHAVRPRIPGAPEEQEQADFRLCVPDGTGVVAGPVTVLSSQLTTANWPTPTRQALGRRTP